MHVKFQLVREKEGLWEDKSRAVAEAQAAAESLRITDVLACFSPSPASFYWLALMIREPQDSGS